MSGCKWCPIWPAEARVLILEAARDGRDHGLGKQCWQCHRVDWNLKSLNAALHEIEAERQAIGAA